MNKPKITNNTVNSLCFITKSYSLGADKLVFVNIVTNIEKTNSP